MSTSTPAPLTATILDAEAVAPGAKSSEPSPSPGKIRRVQSMSVLGAGGCPLSKEELRAGQGRRDWSMFKEKLSPICIKCRQHMNQHRLQAVIDEDNEKEAAQQKLIAAGGPGKRLSEVSDINEDSKKQSEGEGKPSSDGPPIHLVDTIANLQSARDVRVLAADVVDQLQVLLRQLEEMEAGASNFDVLKGRVLLTADNCKLQLQPLVWFKPAGSVSGTNHAGAHPGRLGTNSRSPSHHNLEILMDQSCRDSGGASVRIDDKMDSSLSPRAGTRLLPVAPGSEKATPKSAVIKAEQSFQRDSEEQSHKETTQHTTTGSPRNPARGGDHFQGLTQHGSMRATSRHAASSSHHPGGGPPAYHHLADPSAPLPVQNSKHLEKDESASYATVLHGCVYFQLETLLYRCKADRCMLYLINKKSGDLELFTSCGVGMKKTGRSQLKSVASVTGLASSVLLTGVAANLDTVNLEDVADCPGPTRARNAIFFPIRSIKGGKGILGKSSSGSGTIGVVCLVNKKRGKEAFTVDEERILHENTPTIAYIVETYPAHDMNFQFDPVPLHHLAPLQPYVAPTVALPNEYHCPELQLVYHRDGAEKYVRRQALTDEGTEVAEEGVDRHLKSVAEYIEMVEKCWKQSIVENMGIEQQMRQRQVHIADAREILQRKQRKLDVVKDALVEELKRNAGGSKSNSMNMAPRRPTSKR